MQESYKTKKILGERFRTLFSGKGIDIGCGNSPMTANCVQFDQKDGDANHITEYIKDKFNWVFSSHVLEHMNDPYQAIQEWFKLVAPEGRLIVTVPDEDLYEQGMFPSKYNKDHKWTFTISKEKSWSPKSVNIKDLVATLDGEVEEITLQDKGYDYSLKGVDQTAQRGAMAQIMFIVRRTK
jgi:SAM-dependent methyltransferase